MVIKAKSGKGNKIHVSADEEYIFTVDADFWFTQGISTGDEISEEELEALKNAASFRRAYNKALDLISRRDYCERELFARLCRNFEPPAAERAVERVLELGFIDDDKYAQKLATELFEKKMFSPFRIRSELIRRGVSKDSADNVCEGLDIDFKERIIEILNRKFERQLSTPQGKKRAFNSLVRMGYGFSDIRSAMRELNIDLTDTY
ncbi:MAG TPA: regulatory protein RecX [Clostridia bacterium]|nr:regulatory protein RecX [Clostridia bacterium]